jgi:hypothetical protein
LASAAAFGFPLLLAIPETNPYKKSTKINDYMTYMTTMTDSKYK